MVEPLIIPEGISPELLAWYTDPEAGYWSPLLTQYPKAMMDATETKTLIEAGIFVKAIIATPEEAFEGLTTATEEDILSSVQRDAMNKAIGVNLMAEGVLAATVFASIKKLGLATDAIDEQWRLPVLSAAVDTAYDTTMREYRSAITPLLNRYYLRKYTPLIPETYRLALMAAKEVLPIEEYDAAMAENGMDKGWAAKWREATYEYPNIETLLALYRRGAIDDKAFHGWLGRNAIPHWVRDAIAQLYEVIPPLPDLIRFAVREAFGEHTFDEQYPAYESWATKMGLSKEAAGWYWYAHWDRIDLARMYDNLYRGYWDADKFIDMLRIKDVHEDDREDILNVAYQPPSIREMGYGYDVGAYSEEDITTYRKWGGLSAKDAEKAAAALVDYRLEAEREALRREWMYLFSDEKLTETEFRERLTAVFDMKDRTDLWVARGLLHRKRTEKPAPEVEYRIVTSSEAKWAYVHELRDVEWYKEKLADLGWDEERVTVAVERAKIEMEPTPEEEVPVEYRSLTLGQIQDLYAFQKITVEELPAAFEDVGYTAEDAANLAQILVTVRERELQPKQITEATIRQFYDMRVLSAEELPAEYMKQGYSKEDAVNKALWAKVSVDFPDLRAMYSKGWITADVLVLELRGLGLSEERATDLAMTVVKLEQPERVAAERDLTKAEIVKGVKNKIISAEQGVSLLMDLGYEEWEAWYILAINKVVGVGDPEGYWDMKRVTEQYKKALGKKSKTVPNDLLVWEQRVKDLQAELHKLEEEQAPDDVIAQKSIQVNEAEANYRRLIQAWERSEL